MDSSARSAVVQGAVSLAAVLCVGAVALFVFLKHEHEEEKKTAPPKGEPGIVKIEEDQVHEKGIRTEKATSGSWRDRRNIYGRVVPNPSATVEIRAVVAGTVHAGSSDAWPALGSAVTSKQNLGWLVARVSPQERLDLRGKHAEAQAKLKGADEILKIQSERVKRMESVSGSVPRGELDAALVQLAEARTARATAQATYTILDEALASLDESNPMEAWKQGLRSPIDGEIIELNARPGMALEAGVVIARIADFRKQLVRLDMPQGSKPPAEATIQEVSEPGPPITGEAGRKGKLAGPAGQVDAVSQLQGYLYEVAFANGAPSWRPGRFVKADVVDPAATAQSAVRIPATSLLYHQGHTLVYVFLREEVREVNGKKEEFHVFERRRVHVLGQDGGMFYVSPAGAAGEGVAPDEAVVSQRAQLVLSQEFRGEAEED